MKLYKSQARGIAEEITDAMIRKHAVDVAEGQRDEFVLDIESVIKSYVETGRQVHQEAQNIARSRGAEFGGAFHRIKREVAKRYNYAMGDDALDWIIEQIIEMIFHTSHIEEVWFEDNELRLLCRPIIIRYSQVEDDVDIEVRKRIKNLSEGSLSWDVRYQQIQAEIRRKKGLE